MPAIPLNSLGASSIVNSGPIEFHPPNPNPTKNLPK
jgi:hypothetical protein